MDSENDDATTDPALTCYIELWMRISGRGDWKAVVVVEVKRGGLPNNEPGKAHALHVHQALQANPVDDRELRERLYNWHPC